MSKAHRNSQHSQGLHGAVPGPLHKYYDFQFYVFIEFLSGRTSRSLILASLTSICLLQFQYIIFILFYMNIYIYIRSLFSNDRKKGKSVGRRGGEKLGKEGEEREGIL